MTQMVNSPQPSHYEQLGGATTVKTLVDHFYKNMDTLPEASEIRAIHAPDLTHAKEKLFKFLSGWLGGPQLYIEEYGHPRLRQRHLPFKIGTVERDQWLLCMRLAMQQTGITEKLQQQLYESFYKTADFMRNQPNRHRGGQST